MQDCKHEIFQCNADITRLTDGDDPEKVTGYSADIRVKCVQCGLPFEFVGVPGGYSPGQPMVNFDATELRAPIRPSTDPAAQVNALLK